MNLKKIYTTNNKNEKKKKPKKKKKKHPKKNTHQSHRREENIFNYLVCIWHVLKKPVIFAIIHKPHCTFENFKQPYVSFI